MFAKDENRSTPKKNGDNVNNCGLKIFSHLADGIKRKIEDFSNGLNNHK